MKLFSDLTFQDYSDRHVRISQLPYLFYVLVILQTVYLLDGILSGAIKYKHCSEIPRKHPHLIHDSQDIYTYILDYHIDRRSKTEMSSGFFWSKWYHKETAFLRVLINQHAARHGQLWTMLSYQDPRTQEATDYPLLICLFFLLLFITIFSLLFA